MKKIFFASLFICSFFRISAQEVVDFSQYFKEYDLEGGFFLYNYKTKSYQVSDKTDFVRATSPASTFKIPNSLIALEVGAIKDENEVIKWDGEKRWLPVWDKDHDLTEAYKNSTVWFYQELARRIGEKNYNKYLKACDYGNKDISGGLTQFWLGKSLKISPKNQIEFLVKLYEEKLPFSKRTFEITKRVMVREKTNDYTLRAKTGMATVDKVDIGWFVGYVEKQDNVYFFALRMQKPEEKQMPEFASRRIEITTKILKQMGIM
ncbi:beta-lactamase [Emticicia aquatilis]|uniref:Beta-lactamase n=1 Tax=Emticicia aquatilis TaxID=1537369 RepID=A0A916YXG4_9BACT|nr:class D beta-lactamase [Emticicia aquatilis]GGD65897.1 beta-lactamase [Emticicia aquatilis]